MKIYNDIIILKEESMKGKLINLAKTLELIGIKKMSKEVMALLKIASKDAADEIRSSPHFQDYADLHTSRYPDVFAYMDENPGSIPTEAFKSYSDRERMYLKEGAEDWIKTVDHDQFWKEIDKERIKVIEDLVEKKFKSKFQREYDVREVYGYIQKRLTELSKLKASGSPEEIAFAEACIHVLQKVINAQPGELQKTKEKRFDLSDGNDFGPAELQGEFVDSIIDSMDEISSILEEIISNKNLEVKARAEVYKNGYGGIGGWHPSRFGADEVVVRYETPARPKLGPHGNMLNATSEAGKIEVYSLNENIKFKVSDFRPLMKFIGSNFKFVASSFPHDGYVETKREGFENQMIDPESTACLPQAAQRFYYEAKDNGAYFNKYMYLHITNPFVFS